MVVYWRNLHETTWLLPQSAAAGEIAAAIRARGQEKQAEPVCGNCGGKLDDGNHIHGLADNCPAFPPLSVGGK